MTLEVKDLRGTTVRIGGNFYPVPYGDHDAPGSVTWESGRTIPSAQIAFNDVLMRQLSLGEIQSDVIHLAKLIGVDVPQQEHVYHYFSGLRPDNSAENVSGSLRRVSALFHNIAALFSDWNFVTGMRIPDIPGEHPVFHLNTSGSVIRGLTKDKIHRHGLRGALAYVLPTLYPIPAYGFDLFDPGSDSLDYTAALIGDSIRKPTFPMTANLSKLQGMVNSGQFDQSFPLNKVSYDSFSYTLDGSVLRSIEYNIENKDMNDGTGLLHWRRYHVKIHPKFTLRTDFSPATLPSTRYLFEFVDFYTDVIWEFSWEMVRPVDLSSEYAPHADHQNLGVDRYSYSQYDYPYLYCDSNRGGSSLLNPVEHFHLYSAFSFKKHTRSVMLPEFRNRLSSYLPDLYASVFYSTQDAFDRHFESLQTNHLEALSDLRDIRSILGPLGDLGQLVRHLKQAKFGKSVKAFIDLITDVKLLYEFGLRPTVTDINDIRENGRRIMSLYAGRSLFDEQTINGKFVYPIPDEMIPGIKGATLIARSKVRLSLSENSLLTLLLPVRAAGLLPSLGAIWDLVPFSFVVDWVTNLGARFDSVDTNAMLLAFDVPLSVHSITIVYPFSDDFLDFACFEVQSTADGNDAGLKLYLRSLMTGVPHLIPTRFDFQPPVGPSDWGTVGSLAYKLLS